MPHVETRSMSKLARQTSTRLLSRLLRLSRAALGDSVGRKFGGATTW